MATVGASRQAPPTSPSRDLRGGKNGSRERAFKSLHMRGRLHSHQALSR
jgi:hypothetical protein